MFVIRKRLSADEGAPANTRQNPDTGEIESTPDGGATWYPNPDADPRTNPAGLLPPIPGDECAAAAGMVAQMEIFAQNVFGGTTAVGIASLTLAGMVAVIPGIGWMFSTALFIASSVITAGGATLLTAFTPTVFEQLQCIIVCLLDSDGRFTETTINDFQTAVNDELGGTVGLGVSLMIEAWGYVGFNNAGVLNNDPAADCSGCDFCDCTGTSVNFAVSDQGFVTHAWDIFPAIGTYMNNIFGTGWYAGSAGGSNVIGIAGNVAQVCGTGIQLNITLTGGSIQPKTVKVRVTTSTQVDRKSVV